MDFPADILINDDTGAIIELLTMLLDVNSMILTILFYALVLVVGGVLSYVLFKPLFYFLR